MIWVLGDRVEAIGAAGRLCTVAVLRQYIDGSVSLCKSSGTPPVSGLLSWISRSRRSRSGPGLARPLGARIHHPRNRRRRRMKTVAVLVALLLSVSIVSAAGNEVSGKVKKWDAATHTITLEDGTQLTVPATVKEAAQIKEGAMVKASYEEKDGKKVISKIEVAP